MHPMYASQPQSHYRPSMGNGMSAPNMHMQQTMQCYCPTCNTLLSFPSGATFVQCPQCQTTMNTQPTAPPPIAQPPPPPPVSAPPPNNTQLNFLHCPSCHCLLSHPPTSITIQCPRCMHIIDVTHKAATLSSAADLPPSQPSILAGHTASSSSASSPSKQPSAGDSPSAQELIIRKKRKDPNAPKRASNAYMIFCKERRAQLKLDRPDLPFGQLGKRLGEMWRSMGSEEKRLYEDRATGDRDRYKGEMNSYQSTAMMKGGRGGGPKRHHVSVSHDTGSEEGEGEHDDDGGEDGEGDEGSEEGQSGGHEEEREEEEVKVREKPNGDVKRVKHEVKVDTTSPPQQADTNKEPPSD